MNDPVTAWILQVYLRDRGMYLWLGPSSAVYGGFAAYVSRYIWLDIPVQGSVEHAQTIQDAARAAAEKVCDLSGFEAWREKWEPGALVDN